MGDVFNTGVGAKGIQSGFGDVFHTGVGKTAFADAGQIAKVAAGIYLAPYLMSGIGKAGEVFNLIGGKNMDMIGKAGEMLGATPAGEVAKGVAKNVMAIPGAGEVGSALQTGGEIAVAGKIGMDNKDAILRAMSLPIGGTPQDSTTPATDTSLVTGGEGDTPGVTTPEPGAMSNDPTATNLAASKRRKLSFMQRGLMSTIKTAPGGVASSPALSIPMAMATATGYGTKTKLGM